MSILNEAELGTLKGMAVYWREVSNRDNLEERRRIAHCELDQVALQIGPEKVLRVIAEYVDNQ